MQYSVVNYKTVRENSDFRIDAEYFHPSKLNSLRILKNNPIIFLGDYVLSIKRNETPKDSNIEIYDTGAASSHILTKNLAQTEERTSLKRRAKGGDIIISRLRPYLKQVAYIPTFIDKAYLTTEFFVLRSKDKENISFLTPFLLTEFVQEILFWGQGGTQHPRFQEYDLLNLPLTKNIFGLKEILNKIVSKCCKLVLESDHLYSQAEQFLLSELGLLDWKPKHTLAFVKNFSDTQKAERIDAEYFQPKYEEIIEAVKKYKGGFDTISGQFRQNKKSFKKTPDKEYQYIEIGCVNISDGSVEPIKLQGSELPANAKIKFQKGDVIVSKVRPYRGAIGIVDSENYVGSGAFTVLQENGVVNKETLMVFLRLKPLLDFSLKFNTGTSYPTITDEDILNFPLPKIDSRTQEEIKKKITEMYETKKISKSLLEIAKRGVEIAIEKDEQEAEEWIESEIEKLGVRIQ